MSAIFESKKLIVEVKYTDASKKGRYQSLNNDVDTSVTGTYFLGQSTLLNEYNDFFDIDPTTFYGNKKVVFSNDKIKAYLEEIKKYFSLFESKFVESASQKLALIDNSKDNFELKLKLRVNDTRIFLSMPKDDDNNKYFQSFVYGTITNIIFEEVEDYLLVYPILTDDYFKKFINDIPLTKKEYQKLLAFYHKKHQTDGYRIFGMIYGQSADKNKVNIKSKDFINDAVEFDGDLKESFNVEIAKGCSLNPLIKNIIPDDKIIFTYVEEISTGEFTNFEFNLYGVHITKKNDALSNSNPHICIGWSGLGDLSLCKNKDDLNAKYDEVWPNDKPRAKGQNVGIINKFVNEAKIGDYVIFDEPNAIHIGKIASDYLYDDTNYPDQDPDYVNTRKVTWLKTNISKEQISSNMKSSLAASRSFFSLNDYKSAVMDLINGTYVADEDETSIVSKEKVDFCFDNKSGINLIVYGTPGCGKSYYVQHTLLYDGGYRFDEKGVNCIDAIRTTFFQDYTNTDFVGQIMPIVNPDKSVTYEFNPGPFTLALNKAIQNPDRPIALVIEELNRGNAASIFGDLFQLLDRDNGTSVYNITNVNIQKYLEEQNPTMKFDYIKLPSNLSIFATMNTSDQNVFTLDTAFKRRWKFEKIKNTFLADHGFKGSFIPGMDMDWEEFCNSINEFIVNDKNFINSEDKQLGVYFVDEKGLRKEKTDVSTEKARKEFAYKIFEYLWDDVAKYDREKWFNNIKTLDALIDKYVADGEDEESGINVFSDGIFKKK